MPYYINIETVLSWPVFQTQDFNPQIDLKTLLHANNPRIDPPPLSLATDFEANGAGELLQHFFDKVHIYNPVLDEEKVREYMRDAGLNGLGWDAKSCLLVDQNSSIFQPLLLISAALGVCHWLYSVLNRGNSIRKFILISPIASISAS